MWDAGLGVRRGDSAGSVRSVVGSTTVGGELKGNSEGSFGDKGEPVGACRMILGPPLAVADWSSSVSVAVCPARSGDSMRRVSGLPFAAAGDWERGLRAGETFDSGESAMMEIAESET